MCVFKSQIRVRAKTIELTWCILIAVSDAKALKCNPWECLRY